MRPRTDPPHGFGRYRHKRYLCRCDICRAGNAEYMREYRNRVGGGMDPARFCPVCHLVFDRRGLGRHMSMHRKREGDATERRLAEAATRARDPR